jgi:hypothetical protein
MRERRRIEAVGHPAKEGGDGSKRTRCGPQTLGRLLRAELTGVVVGDDEDVEWVAGEHGYLRVAAGTTL